MLKRYLIMILALSVSISMLDAMTKISPSSSTDSFTTTEDPFSDADASDNEDIYNEVLPDEYYRANRNRYTQQQATKPQRNPVKNNKFLNNELIRAAKAGDFGIIEHLLKDGADLDVAVDEKRNSALAIAVEKGDEYSVENLLAFGKPCRDHAQKTFDLAVRLSTKERRGQTNRTSIKNMLGKYLEAQTNN